MPQSTRRSCHRGRNNVPKDGGILILIRRPWEDLFASDEQPSSFIRLEIRTKR